MGQTDTILFTCSACSHSAEFPKAQEGKAIYCPKCQAAQVIRSPGSATDRFRAERIPTGRIVKAENEAAAGAEAAEQPHGMAGTARIDFVCGACNHTSRISAALSGQPVRCPTCGTVQLAGVAGLRVVRIDEQGKLPFTCTACNYAAKLNPEYSGKAIRCPKCQGAQVVPRILRDPSGAFKALPAGAPANPPAAGTTTRPATGPIAKPATGQFTKPATGSVPRPTGGAPAATRSEPSPALRTPAGGIPVAQPMPAPTPLPGSLVTPPPGSLKAPVPEPTSSASAMALPMVPTDDADAQLDLGDLTPAKPTPADDAPAARPRGGVVRRSGRMSTQTRTPQPGDQPTLEPARAVRVEADSAPSVSEPPASQVADTAPRMPPTSRPSAPAPSSRAWLVPALGVGLAVAGIAAIVLLVMLNAASGREGSLQQQLTAEKKRLETAQGEAAELQRKLGETEAARKQAATERDDQHTTLEALRREHEQLKAEHEQLKAEAKAKATPALPKP